MSRKQENLVDSEAVCKILSSYGTALHDPGYKDQGEFKGDNVSILLRTINNHRL